MKLDFVLMAKFPFGKVLHQLDRFICQLLAFGVIVILLGQEYLMASADRTVIYLEGTISKKFPTRMVLHLTVFLYK